VIHIAVTRADKPCSAVCAEQLHALQAEITLFASRLRAFPCENPPQQTLRHFPGLFTPKCQLSS